MIASRIVSRALVLWVALSHPKRVFISCLQQFDVIIDAFLVDSDIGALVRLMGVGCESGR